MLRSSALKLAQRSSSLRLAVQPRRFMGAVSTGGGVDMDLGRTPDRTAELQKLAAEHNGFLFGELVRCRHLRCLLAAVWPVPAWFRRRVLP